MRKSLLEQHAPPGWNIRVFSEDDFLDLCRERKIIVREVPLESPAFSIHRQRGQYLYLDCNLRGVERLQVALHELGHHLLHKPGIQFFLGWNARTEEEAEVFSICALIPRTILPPKFAWSEIADLYGYPDWMLHYRWMVHQRWGL